MRWIWIVLAAIVGGVFAHAIWRLQAQLHFAEFSLVGDLPAECIYATVVVAAILFGNIALKNAPIGGREWFLSNWKYPSIWIAVLFSLAFSFLLEQLTTASQPIRIALVLLFLIALTLLVAAPRFQLKRLRRFSQEATTSARSNLAVPDAWWRSDDLVEHDSHDRFEFTSVVVRLSERLNSGRDFSVFLDGPYGSGKSSLLAMARSRAGEKLGSATCTLSCWDFPTSADAIQVILDRAVASLSRCVDVTEFRHLPLQYVRTVSGNDRWVSAVITLVHLLAPTSNDSPSQLIDRLNSVLKESGRTLLIVIEDLDRTGLDNRHLQPIFALLHYFRKADRINLIVAGSSEQGFDPDSRKLFDFVETVPGITTESLHRELATFERLIWQPTIIRVTMNRAIPPLLYLDPESRQALDGYDYPLDAMRRLVRTPRSFKQLLRETEADWTRLAGEVNLNELLISNTLRLFAPSAFWFVDEYRSPRLNGPHNNKDQEAWVRRRVSAWEQKASGGQIGTSFTDEAWILAMVLLGLSRSTARQLPGDDEPTGPRYFESPDTEVLPQSILSPDFGDEYWRRIRNRDLGPDPVRDQDLLRLDKDSQSDPNRRRELAVALVGDGVAVKRWRRLSHGWPVTAALELADDVINELKSSSAESRRFEALAIVRTRLRSRAEGDESQIYEWIKRTAIENAHCDWAVLTCLLDRWAQGDIGQDRLVSDEARKDLLKHVQATVADALRSGRLRPIDYLRPTEEWSALAGVVSIAGTSIGQRTKLASSGHEWIRELAEAIFDDAQQAPTKWTGHLIVLFWGVNGIQASKEWAVPAFGVNLCRRAFSWISEQPIEHKIFCTGMRDSDRSWFRGEEVLQQARAWLEKDPESDQ